MLCMCNIFRFLLLNFVTGILFVPRGHRTHAFVKQKITLHLKLKLSNEEKHKFWILKSLLHLYGISRATSTVLMESFVQLRWASEIEILGTQNSCCVNTRTLNSNAKHKYFALKGCMAKAMEKRLQPQKTNKTVTVCSGVIRNVGISGGNGENEYIW